MRTYILIGWMFYGLSTLARSKYFSINGGIKIENGRGFRCRRLVLIVILQLVTSFQVLGIFPTLLIDLNGNVPFALYRHLSSILVLVLVFLLVSCHVC